MKQRKNQLSIQIMKQKKLPDFLECSTEEVNEKEENYENENKDFLENRNEEIDETEIHYENDDESEENAAKIQQLLKVNSNKNYKKEQVS